MKKEKLEKKIDEFVDYWMSYSPSAKIQARNELRELLGVATKYKQNRSLTK